MAVSYVTFSDDKHYFSADVVTYCDGILFIHLPATTFSPKEVISTIFTNVKDEWLSHEEEEMLGGKVNAVVCSLNGIPVLISGDANDSNGIYEDWKRRLSMK